MQTTNATYKSILQGAYIVEYKAVINGVTYDQSKIYGVPNISSSLFEKFSIGNAISSMLNITILPQGTIPPMSLVEVFYRVKNGSLTSDWMPKGKYYIDVRKLNKDGVLALECYDSMLMTEYTFMQSGEWEPTPAVEVVEAIANEIGTTVESGTDSLISTDSKIVPFVPVVGENGTTAREMLCSIGAVYGGNWIIDEEGKLKLVQLDTPANPINIGVLAIDFEKSDAFDAVSRVILKTEEQSGFRSPDVDDATWDAMTGRILEGTCPWASQELADDLLDYVDGYVYQPFTALGVNIDPACQLGDGVTVNGLTSVIFSEEITLDMRCAVDISAPYEEEVNHEYPYRTAMDREIAKREEQNNAMRSTISQTVEGLRIELMQYTDDEVDGHATEQRRYLRYSSEGIELGDVNADTQAKLTTEKLGFYAGGDEKAYIGKDEDGIYKFFVVNGHIVNKLELGDHWDLVASGEDNQNRLTIRYRG